MKPNPSQPIAIPGRSSHQSYFYVGHPPTPGFYVPPAPQPLPSPAALVVVPQPGPSPSPIIPNMSSELNKSIAGPPLPPLSSFQLFTPTIVQPTVNQGLALKPQSESAQDYFSRGKPTKDAQALIKDKYSSNMPPIIGPYDPRRFHHT